MGDQLYAKRTTPDQVQEPAKTAFQRKPGPVDPTRIPLWATLAYGNQVPPSLRLPVVQPPQVETVKQESGSPADVSAEKHIERALQDKENTTGLPDTLKVGIETLSGLAMDDVQVHYNSPKPAEVNALAYTQGTEIHVGPGQEQHLAHEAWHVVQQMQRRVSPTLELKGIFINNDVSLEREADTAGEQAARIPTGSSKISGLSSLAHSQQNEHQPVGIEKRSLSTSRSAYTQQRNKNRNRTQQFLTPIRGEQVIHY